MHDELFQLWQDWVNSRHLFRGMSAKDLKFPLAPHDDLFAPMTPAIVRLLDTLQQAVLAGFQFTLIEKHGGRTWEHKLRDIVTWSKRDLQNPCLDFTADHDSAANYADNWQGSQLKQNIKYIVDHLPQRKHDPLLAGIMTPDDWRLADEIRNWISRESPEHKSVALWVRRSYPAFQPDA